MRRLALELAGAWLILISTTIAHAAGGLPIVAGSEYSKPGGVITVTAAVTFAMNMDAGRSYACTVVGQNIDTNTGFSAEVTDPEGKVSAGALRGTVTPSVSGSMDQNLVNNRVVYTAQLNGQHLIQLTDFKAGGESVRVECVETTLYGVYNTNINNFNFMELTNTTNDPISGSWTAVNWDGQSFTGDFTVLPNRRADVNLHQVVGAGKFGQVMLTHDGPRGALIGYISQYIGSVTDFRLAVSNRMAERDQSK